jgi:hypothetical protein
MAYEIQAIAICDLCGKREDAVSDGRGIRHPRGWYIIDVSLQDDHSKHGHVDSGECPYDLTSHVCGICIKRVRNALQPITRVA